jgi:hypothetical protein
VGRVERLVETKDAWGFGGTSWLSKHHAVWKDGPARSPEGQINALHPSCEYYLQRFALDTGARGLAIWFRRGPADPALPLGNRSLLGWVALEREGEAAGWIAFLNGEIKARLRDAAAARAEMTDAEHEAASAAHLQTSLAWIGSLGVPVPQAATMDELVDKLKAAAADGPIDLRSKKKE